MPPRQEWRLPINKAVNEIIKSLGWNVKRFALECGFKPRSLYSPRSGYRDFTTREIERIRETTGIDPYVLAFCLYADKSKLPQPIQEKLEALKEEWLKQLEIFRTVRHRSPMWAQM